MLELIVVIFCLLFNAVLSGTEMAFVSTGRAQLRELARKGSKKAAHLLEMKNRPERILSIIQIGITLVGAVAAAVGGAGAEEMLTPILMRVFNLSSETASSLSIAFVVIPLTVLTVIFGELFPKALALRRSVKISLLMTPFLLLADRSLRPIVTGMETVTKKLLRLFRVPTHTVHAPEAQESSESSQQYAIAFGLQRRMKVKEAMLPFAEAVTVDTTMTMDEVEKKFFESGHTRLPVMKNGKILGTLNLKEFHYFKASGQSDWLALARGVIYFEENTDLIQALKMLQGQHRHMAIVLKEGELVGLITLTNILEEFVGDIYDEDDDNLVKQLVRSRSKLNKRALV